MTLGIKERLAPVDRDQGFYRVVVLKSYYQFLAATHTEGNHEIDSSEEDEDTAPIHVTLLSYNVATVYAEHSYYGDYLGNIARCLSIL